MKITTSYLKKIVKEEIQRLLSEQAGDLADFDQALTQLHSVEAGTGQGVAASVLDAAIEQFKQDMAEYPRSQPGRPSIGEYLEVFRKHFDNPEQELLAMLPLPDEEYMTQRAREAEDDLRPGLEGDPAPSGQDLVQRAGDTVLRMMRQYDR